VLPVRYELSFYISYSVFKGLKYRQKIRWTLMNHYMSIIYARRMLQSVKSVYHLTQVVSTDLKCRLRLRVCTAVAHRPFRSR
jgi:hypothetical protein